MPNQDPSSIDADTLVLIVVGAHPKAEQADRPIAYMLRQQLTKWLARRFEGETPPLNALVVTDVWYLNDNSLRRCPAISIGGPGVNAVSAYLGDKLPSAFVVDDQYMVQMDLDLNDLVCCCWGVSTEATAHAVEAFLDRYLDEFMEAATRARAV
jgi:hypothetical protein